MTNRKGEITRDDLDSKWPHHIALPAEKVLGLKNSELVRSVAALVAAVLAGHEQATDAVPPHVAERHRADWFVIAGHPTS